MYKALCYYYPIPSSEQLLLALLNSHYKKLEFVDFSTRLNVENKLRELYEEKKALEDEGEERENQIQENDIDEYSNVLVNLLYTPFLLKSLDKEEVVQDKVEEYLNLSQIRIKKDSLAWWDLHSTKFPILSELLKVYLAVSATFTPSEWLFSDAGNLIAVKRTRLLPELFKQMIFLKRNINRFESIHPLL